MEIDKFDNEEGSNEYLYDNLDGGDWYYESTKPTNNISGIYGYWTLSSDGGYSDFAWIVYSSCDLSDYFVSDDDSCGVRAVINLKI